MTFITDIWQIRPPLPHHSSIRFGMPASQQVMMGNYRKPATPRMGVLSLTGSVSGPVGSPHSVTLVTADDKSDSAPSTPRSLHSSISANKKSPGKPKHDKSDHSDIESVFDDAYKDSYDCLIM